MTFSHLIHLNQEEHLGLDWHQSFEQAVLPAHVIRMFIRPSSDDTSSEEGFKEACKDLDRLGNHMVRIQAAGTVAGTWRIKPYTIGPEEFEILKNWKENPNQPVEGS